MLFSLDILLSLEKGAWNNIRQDMIQRRQLEAQCWRAKVIVYVIEANENSRG